MHPVKQLYLLFVQLPSVVPCIDSISKKFPLCQAKSLQQRDSNPHSSDSKSDALSVGPCILSTVSVQLPSVVPCIDSISKKFPLCQAKSLQQRDSTPQSSDSKSDAFSVGPCILSINCILFVQLPSVIPCIDSISKKFPLQKIFYHRWIRTPNLLI